MPDKMNGRKKRRISESMSDTCTASSLGDERGADSVTTQTGEHDRCASSHWCQRSVCTMKYIDLADLAGSGFCN